MNQTPKKVNVVGTSGIGKSSFAKALANKLKLSYIELDALFWKPNWQESNDEEFLNRLEESLKCDGWVLDGNYSIAEETKWKNADTIIWLDYRFSTNLYRALNRAVRRIISGEELWADTGNKETFRGTFLSKDSVLLWTLQTHHKNRKHYLALMENPRLKHIKFVRLRNSKQAEAFLQNL